MDIYRQLKVLRIFARQLYSCNLLQSTELRKATKLFFLLKEDVWQKFHLMQKLIPEVMEAHTQKMVGKYHTK